MEITDPLYSNSLKNLIQGLSEAARKGWMEVGDAERLTRVLMSQGNDRFADFFVTENFNALREPEVAAAIASKLATPVAKAQQGLNYSFGTEGHHGISVSSIEAASRHLPFEQRLEFLKALKDDYTYSGTDPEDMFPLSGIAHQQKGTASKTDPYNAHFDSDPKTLAKTFKPNQGTWQGEDYTNITDPRKLATEFWNRSGSPQIRAAEIAFDQPSEVAWREGLADKLGIRERNLYLSGQTNGKPITATNKAALGELGIKNEVLKQGMQEAYGQTYRPPNPDAPKTPYEARPPRPWAESKVLNPNYKPAATTAKAAAGVAPVSSDLLSKYTTQINNRINRRLGKSPFDDVLDTNSPKYLENIGAYQRFIDLDETSKAALGLYGENFEKYYANLNRQLRSGSTAGLTSEQLGINQFLESNLNKALDSLPDEQTDLFRSIKDPAREGLANLKIGDLYTDKGFGSFSSNQDTALRFVDKDTSNALVAVKGANGKNIGPVMEYDESEFLQKPGSQYRLEAVDEVFSPKIGGNIPRYTFKVDPSATPKPTAKPAAKPVAPKPAAKPVVQVAPKPAAKPAAKPAPTTKLSSVQTSDLTSKPKPKPGISRTVTKPQPKVSSGAKPVAKPVAKPAAKPTPKPTPTKPALINARNPGSASMQIRAQQRAAPDVLQIHPGMSLPSNSLVQGI